MAVSDADVLLWAKGEDATSEVGVNGVWTGTPSYKACKFNNGFYNNNAVNYITFDETGNFNPNKFIWEFPFKTDWSWFNTTAGDAGFHTFFGWDYNNNNRMHVFAFHGQGLILWIRVGGTIKRMDIVNASWSALSLNRLLVVFDKDGIDGGADTMRIYLNDVLIGSSTTAVSNQTSINGRLRPLITHNGVSASSPFNGVIDNPKIYFDTSVTGAKIIEIDANKDNEGFPVAYIPSNKFNGSFYTHIDNP